MVSCVWWLSRTANAADVAVEVYEVRTVRPCARLVGLREWDDRLAAARAILAQRAQVHRWTLVIIQSVPRITKTVASGIHAGEITHNHGQWMALVSLSVMKMSVSAPAKLMPPDWGVCAIGCLP